MKLKCDLDHIQRRRKQCSWCSLGYTWFQKLSHRNVIKPEFLAFLGIRATQATPEFMCLRCPLQVGCVVDGMCSRCLLIRIDQNWSELIRVDQNLSELIRSDQKKWSCPCYAGAASNKLFKSDQIRSKKFGAFVFKYTAWLWTLMRARSLCY